MTTPLLGLALILGGGSPTQGGAGLAAGSEIRVEFETAVDSRTASPGDRVQGRIVERSDRWEGAVVQGRIDAAFAGTLEVPGWVRVIWTSIEPAGAGSPVVVQIAGRFEAGSHRPRTTLLWAIAGGVTGSVASPRRARAAGTLGGSLAGFLVSYNLGRRVRDIRFGKGARAAFRLTSPVGPNPEDG